MHSRCIFLFISCWGAHSMQSLQILSCQGLTWLVSAKGVFVKKAVYFFEFWGSILPSKMIICLLQPWFFAIINAGCVFQGYRCYQVGLELTSMKSCAAFSTVAAWPTSWPLTEHHLADVSHVELCVTLAVVWWQMQKGNEKAKWKIPNEALLLGDWGGGSCTSSCGMWGKVECFGHALSKHGSLCFEEMHFLWVQYLLSAWIAQWKHVQALLLCRDHFFKLMRFPSAFAILSR